MKISYPVLFSTVFGSHLWSMETEKSDLDIIEIYVVPTKTILCGGPYPETMPQIKMGSPSMDTTRFEIGHLINQLIKGNCNAIWMTCSPLKKITCDVHEELISIVKSNLSRSSYHSIRGMTESQISDSTKRGLGMKGLRTAWRTAEFGINLLEKNELVFDPAPDIVTDSMCESQLNTLDSAYAQSVLPSFVNPDPFRSWLLKLRLSNLEE